MSEQETQKASSEQIEAVAKEMKKKLEERLRDATKIAEDGLRRAAGAREDKECLVDLKIAMAAYALADRFERELHPVTPTGYMPIGSLRYDSTM